MKRNTIIAALTALLAVTATTVIAQPADRLPRVAYVVSSGDTAALTEDHVAYGEFFRELRRLGYVEGQTIVIERWSALGQGEEFIAQIVRTVVDSRPDLIVARGRRVMNPLIEATKTVPIVGVGTFPVELQAKLAHPGGNVTGFMGSVGDAVFTKRLQLLQDAVPDASRFAWITPRRNWEGALGDNMRQAAAKLGVELIAAIVEDPPGEPQIRRAFAELENLEADALYLGNMPRPQVPLAIELALATELPTIGGGRNYVELGIMMSYFASVLEREQRAASFVDRILEGAYPGDLPIEQGRKFDFVVNLKTAKALGITLPFRTLAFATEVIE